jgi:hypothetical protein
MMNVRGLRPLNAAALTVMLLVPVPAVMGDTHGTESSQERSPGASEQQALRQEVDALKAELDSIKEMLQVLRPDLTMVMPDFAERFHVMHRAGDAGDWAVANHELSSMRQIIGRAKRLNPQQGPMLEAFMLGPLENLEKVIMQRDDEAFDKALDQTIQSCNGCHQALGSPFIQIALETPDELNMRHPHKLEPSKAPRDHSHGARVEDMMGEMMESTPGGHGSEEDDHGGTDGDDHGAMIEEMEEEVPGGHHAEGDDDDH